MSSDFNTLNTLALLNSSSEKTNPPQQRVKTVKIVQKKLDSCRTYSLHSLKDAKESKQSKQFEESSGEEIMTAQEAKTALESQSVALPKGWSYLLRIRKGHWYVYAQRKLRGKKIERYICSLAVLADFTIDRILVKLHCNALPTPGGSGCDLLTSSKQEA